VETSPRQTCEDLVALIKHVKISLGVLAERHGLTHMQLYVMDTINRGGMTMGRVAGNLHCDASNITGIIDRLVVLGLVTRQESEQDRRIKVLKLTEAGQKLFAKITDEMPEALGCTRLLASEQSALHHLVKRFV
jgi:DNA-binding MarR family transcriptional regulator